MNKKSNFIISINGNRDISDVEKCFSLPNYYKFILNDLKINISYSDNAIFSKSEDGNIIIILAGNIYQTMDNSSVQDYLLNTYLKFNKDFVKNLNGSFCLFFADKNTGGAYFATDRFNTRKIFKYKNDDSLIGGTDINKLPLKDCKLS
jgi:hypothetical protein